MLSYFRICFAFILFSAVAQAAPGKPFPVGYWYCESTQDGEKVFSIMHYKGDGSFVADFRECRPNWTRLDPESGHWSIAGDRLLATTEIVMGNTVQFSDEYQVVSYDGHVWLSRLVGGDEMQAHGGSTFKLVRVTADSRLPDCDQLS